MSDKFRFLEIESSDNARMSLATEEAIFHEVISGRSMPTFRFYRHKNAIILGCFQLAEQEVDMDVANKNKIQIVKRFTGGGAVYHDLGNLNFSVITKDNYGIGTNVKTLFGTMINGAVNAFASLGMNPQSGKLNDVTVNGKKILGAAASIRQKAVLFHAATLVNTNLPLLASVLKVPGIKLKDKGVATILERVTNIKAESGKNEQDVREALKKSYSDLLNMELVPGELTKEEKDLAQRLYNAKYSTEEWNMGRELLPV